MSVISEIGLKEIDEIRNNVKQGHGKPDQDMLDKVLISAIINDNLDLLKEFISFGADVHYKNERPLFVAICHNRVGMINELLRYGASIDGMLKKVNLEFMLKVDLVPGLIEILLRLGLYDKVTEDKMPRDLSKKNLRLLISWGWWHEDLNRKEGYEYVSYLGIEHKIKETVERMSERFWGIIRTRLWMYDILKSIRDEDGTKKERKIYSGDVLLKIF